jgi:biotin transport system substrate-specific component
MKQKIKKLSLSIRDICFISVFTAVIAVSAQVAIPLPGGVPVTMQTFAVPLAGLILGAKKGTLAVVVYILLGMMGVPVFSAFRGGFGVIFGATGGFILTFPLIALLAGIASDINIKFIPAGLVLGTAVNYAGGLLMFCAVTSSSIGEAFVLCVMPFILPDILKIILAGGIGISVRKILVRSKIL